MKSRIILYMAVVLGSSLVKGMEFKDKEFYCAWGMANCKGWRASMEDCYSAITPLTQEKKDGFFAVFDGHAGVEAAQYAASMLPKVFKPSFNSDGLENIQKLKESFSIVDEEIIKEEFSGSTAAVVYMQEDDNNIKRAYMSWAGDSKIMLCDALCKTVKFISVDHKPQSPNELIRIMNNGGMINFNGVWRVNNILAMSRAFGNKDLKLVCPGAVIVDPEVHSELLSSDDIILVASDGFWDVINDKEVLTILKNVVVMCQKSIDRKDSENMSKVLKLSDDEIDSYLSSTDSEDDGFAPACDEGNDAVLVAVARWLRNIAFERGSKDNISVLVIRPSFKD